MSSHAVDLLAPIHRLSVEQYLQASEAGVFERGPRVELIDGVIVEMAAQNTPHLSGVAWLTKHLVPQLDPRLILMPQLPAKMPELDSVPEPDIWVIEEATIRDDAPFPLLVVEVAVSSLGYDRVTKARLYARRGVADYWIVNVAEACVEVHRKPAGDGWGARTVHRAGETLEPLRLEGVGVDVGALLDFIAG